MLSLTIGDGGTPLSVWRDSCTFLYTALPALNFLLYWNLLYKSKIVCHWTIFSAAWTLHIVLVSCLLLIHTYFLVFVFNISYWIIHGTVGTLHIVCLFSEYFIYIFLHCLFSPFSRLVVATVAIFFPHRSTMAYWCVCRHTNPNLWFTFKILCHTCINYISIDCFVFRLSTPNIGYIVSLIYIFSHMVDCVLYQPTVHISRD